MLDLYKSLFEVESKPFEVLEKRLHCTKDYDADQTSNCCNFLAWLFYT